MMLMIWCYLTFLFDLLMVLPIGFDMDLVLGPSIKDNEQFQQYIIDRHELRSPQLNSRDAGKQFA